MTEKRDIGVDTLVSGETRRHQTGSQAVSAVPRAGCHWLARTSLERARLPGLRRAPQRPDTAHPDGPRGPSQVEVRWLGQGMTPPPPPAMPGAGSAARGLDEANQALGLGDDPHILRASPIYQLLGSSPQASCLMLTLESGRGSDLRV